jgi:two-component system LytT family sensor kinase
MIFIAVSRNITYAESDEGLVVLLLLVSLGLLIRYYILHKSEVEKNRTLTLYLSSSQQEAERLRGEEKRLKEIEGQLKEEVQQKKIENLRFALNPHSFKNTLISIQSMALNTFESVRGLSTTIDYMLYDAQQPFVDLERELEFADQYMGLYQRRLRIDFDVQKELDLSHRPDFAGKFSIAPLITAGFIENAFKHGDTETAAGFIHAKMEIAGPSSLLFTVRNKIRTVPYLGKGGLGQAKMKERLDLLYPSKHHLEYKNENGIFTAILKLELHERKNLVHPG